MGCVPAQQVQRNAPDDVFVIQTRFCCTWYMVRSSLAEHDVILEVQRLGFVT